MRTINTIRVIGVDYAPVKVECEITPGIGIHLVGLADLAVKESLLRTITALQSCGYRIPGKKVIINLAPADLTKSGECYDLPIALSIIGESKQADTWANESLVVVGELGLDGEVRAVPGAVQACRAAVEQGFGCIIPRANAKEVAELFGDYEPIYPVGTLVEAVEVASTLTGEHLWDLPEVQEDEPEQEGWWNRIVGQEGAKRALEIAAAGGHNVFLMGAPGSGKTALAKAMIDILPPMKKNETMEVASVWSAAGRNMPIRQRPFRAPHVSSSLSALLGGGASDRIMPGEVSLANRGVLYLDAFAEMPRASAEALRAPMEDGKIVIHRLKNTVEFPAKFQLVLGSCACPCGWYGEGDRCTCTDGQRAAYLARLSGPIMDCVDVQCWVHAEGRGVVIGESASVVAERVAAARVRQIARQGKLNAELTIDELAKYIPTGNEELEFAETIIERLGLSARAWSRMLKMAMTIADLEGADAVRNEHLAEAASFRFLDRSTI